MKTLFAAIGMIAGLLAVTGCHRESPTILLTLPNNYKGLILISENRSSDRGLIKSGNLYTLSIPASGRVEVKTLAPFSDWHKVRAQYENGKKLNSEDPGFSETQDAFLELNYVSEHGIYGMVGTLAEYGWILKQDCKNLPLGKRIDLIRGDEAITNL